MKYSCMILGLKSSTVKPCRYAAFVLSVALTSFTFAQTSTTDPATTGPAAVSVAAPATLPMASLTTHPATQQSEAATAPATTTAVAASTAPVQPTTMSAMTADTGAPASQPSIAPTAAYPSRHSLPMPGDYASLISRSIFVRGNQVTYDRPANAPSNNTSVAPIQEIIRPERALVFNGVTESDSAIALIEDTNAHHVLTVRVGDSIASGKITAITLNNIDYLANGRVTHIAIGQNLQGESSTATGSASIAGPMSATTLPTSGGTLTGGADSIADRMRRRRLQETGGK